MVQLQIRGENTARADARVANRILPPGSKAADWERHWGRIVPVASLCRYMEGLGMTLSASNVSGGAPGGAARRP
jgi:hypothetical protein